MSNTRKRLLVGACGAASVTALPAYLTAPHSELDAGLTVVMWPGRTRPSSQRTRSA